MRFLSNFGCKIIFMCSFNFWQRQDYNSLLKEALVTRPLSASGLFNAGVFLAVDNHPIQGQV